VVTGGFVTTALGLRISSRTPGPALLLGGLCAAAWFAMARRRGAVTADLARVEEWISRRWLWLVAAIAVLAALAATRYHAFSATGSDASGYLSYTKLLLDGQLMREEPLASVARWLDGPATLAPLGWRAALIAGYQVPTYAIGLPLLMAPWHALGGLTAASLLVPATLALAVVATSGVAHAIGGRTAAIVAAVWLATSPVALIESMQVMSDVPVTAAWMMSWWLVFKNRSLAGGAAAAIAILIRPNLAPIAVVPFAYVAFVGAGILGRISERVDIRARVAGAAGGAGRSAAFRNALWFALPVVLAGGTVGWLQWLYFGSPFRSGYGTAGEIYSIANVAPNARLYARWLADTHGPWLFAAPLALLLRRGPLAWLLSFALLVIAAYLVYAIFETWTYLRFMLPAIAIAMIAVALLAAALIDRLPVAGRASALAAVVFALAAMDVAAARELGVFRFADRQARGAFIGERLASTLPVNTVFISGEQSGTLRYYSGRAILRSDLIAPEAMPDAIDWLTLNGYQLWVVLDDWEEEAFRKTFPALASASIDYEPILESAAGVGIRTRAWRVRSVTARSSNRE
jgi:hypothetical protein